MSRLCLILALFALALTLPLHLQIGLWDLGFRTAAADLDRTLSIYLSDVPALIAFLAWLLTPDRRRVGELPRWLTGTLVAFALLATLSALWSLMPLKALYYSARLWMLLVLYAVIATTPRLCEPLTWGVVSSAALQALIGIVQFLRQGSVGLAMLSEVPLDPAQPGISVITVEGMRIVRAYGLTPHPNILGGVLAVATCLGVGLVLQRRGWTAGLALGLTALCFLGMLFSFSRSAWAGLAVAGSVAGVLLWYAARRGGAALWPRIGVVLAVLLVCGLLFVITQWPLLQPRLGLTTEGVEIRSMDERAALEAAAWTLIREHPWLGVGFANFGAVTQRREHEIAPAYPLGQPVHRVPLLAAAELGMPGALIWLILNVGPWIVMWARRHTWLAGFPIAGAAISTAAALVALTVIGWFDFYPWLTHQGRLLTYISLSLWAKTIYPTLEGGTNDSRPIGVATA